ncbi:high affinity copper uptake protein 1-like [Babylonia areolata]|uniref:high affinity copper uptake protein 1-like n=1 Tax=Babylonia areolata TaxID=304850 RepID=UPI003FD3987B
MDHSHHMMMNSTMAMSHGNMSMSTANPHSGHMGHNTTGMDHGNMDHGDMDHGDMDHGDMDHGMGGMDHGMMMQMFFHTGVTEYILFEKLHTSNAGGMVGACFAIFALSVLYEGLKYFREFLLRRATVASRSETYTPSTGSANGVAYKQPETGPRMLSGSHGLQTLLHMVQVFVSYCLMLVFMTYNVYLCISIIIGAGLGYFLFGWRRAMVVDMNEHCH